MYSTISKHDGVNYSKKLSELRKINPNPATVAPDSVLQEKVLEPSSSSKKPLIIAAGVLLLIGFVVVKFVLKKKTKPKEQVDPRRRNRMPVRSPAPVRNPAPVRKKPQWVIQLAVLLAIGGVAGISWVIAKKKFTHSV
jgi:hypothetical protein